MNTQYDIVYLESTLYMLKNEIEDLNTWSTYHGDIAQEEIQKMQNLYKCIEEIMKREVKTR